MLFLILFLMKLGQTCHRARKAFTILTALKKRLKCWKVCGVILFVYFLPPPFEHHQHGDRFLCSSLASSNEFQLQIILKINFFLKILLFLYSTMLLCYNSVAKVLPMQSNENHEKGSLYGHHLLLHMASIQLFRGCDTSQRSC